MIEVLIFLVVMFLAVVSYKIGTGEWFFPVPQNPTQEPTDPAPSQLHDDPSTVATSTTRAVP